MDEINETVNKIHNKIDSLIFSNEIRESKKDLREEVEKLKKMALDFGYYEGLKQVKSSK